MFMEVYNIYPIWRQWNRAYYMRASMPKELYYYYYRVRNYFKVLGESIREVLEELKEELRNYNYIVY